MSMISTLDSVHLALDVERTIVLFRVQRGMHWCSVLSPMSPHWGRRRIYARSTTFLPHTSLRFDQSKAVRWRVYGRLWQQPFGNSAQGEHQRPSNEGSGIR